MGEKLKVSCSPVHALRAETTRLNKVFRMFCGIRTKPPKESRSVCGQEPAGIAGIGKDNGCKSTESQQTALCWYNSIGRMQHL